MMARQDLAAHSARKRHFLSHLHIKCIILPRQARDKHRENSKKWPFSAGRPGPPRLRQAAPPEDQVRKRIFCAAILTQTDHVTLPRQARDEHRESTQKRKIRFSAQRCRRFVSSQLCAPWVDYMRKAGARRPPRSLIHPGATTWSLDSTLSSAASRKTLVMQRRSSGA